VHVFIINLFTNKNSIFIGTSTCQLT